VDSQPGKMASWAFAVLFLQGHFAQADLDKLATGDAAAARALYAWLIAEHPERVAFIRSIDGLSQDETLDRLWEEYFHA